MKASNHRNGNLTIAVVLVLLTSLFLPATITAATSQPSDRKIEQAVRDALERNSALTLVHASVSNRVVDLSGEVEHYQDKANAEAVARSVFGVRAVHSSISITTPQVSDGELQRNLEDRIHFARADIGMTFPDVQLIVHDGIVTLSGQVNDEVEHAVILALAGTANGVRGVQDNLQLLTTPADDETVRIEINKTVYGDSPISRIGVYPVQATFRNGTVTLMGEVDTPQDEADIVARIRSIHGVISVNDELLVRLPAMKQAVLATESGHTDH
jgi:osmotically-inducible protein OsmY